MNNIRENVLVEVYKNDATTTVQSAKSAFSDWHDVDYGELKGKIVGDNIVILYNE